MTHVPQPVYIDSIPIDDECVYGLVTKKAKDDENISKIFSEIDNQEEFIPRKGIRAPYWSMAFRHWKTRINEPWANKWELRETNQNRRKFTRKIPKRDDTRSTLTPEALNNYKQKFAQRMHENILEFERFCTTYPNNQLTKSH